MKKGGKWYQSFSNWIIIVACAILIPMLIINISIMFQAKSNEDEVPSVFGIKPFMVLSGSMENEIHVGDLILTRVVDPATLEVNDVIAFRDAEGTVTTHRIIDIVVEDGVTYFITKGDNNNSQDKNLVEYADVEGIYIGRIPGIGSMMKSLSEPTTIIIIVIGITAIFVIGFMISNKKQREADRLEFLEYKRQKEKEERQEEVKKENVQEKVIKEQPKEEIVEEEIPEIPEEIVEEPMEKETISEEQIPEEVSEPEEIVQEVVKEKTQEEKEREEFLEYKRMKEEQEKKSQEQKEYEEFLAFKKMKEEYENSKKKED